MQICSSYVTKNRKQLILTLSTIQIDERIVETLTYVLLICYVS